MSLNITVINALSELERYGWTYIPGGPDEVKCRCPVHDDENPSVSLNIAKNVWICHAAQCKAKGDIIALLAYIGKVQRKTVIVDLLNRYPELEDTKVIDQERVEKYHQKIWNSELLPELYKRGLTKEDIREHRLGFDHGRIIIPVYNLQKQVVNLRKYLPGAPGPEKMKNLRGYKTQALYLPDRLKYQTVWICGGELKAIVANRLLNQHNIGAVSVTGAEGSWHKSFTKFFKNKIVFICMDIDDGGKEASKIVANFLFKTAQSIFIVNLPLDKQKYPKGDINDYIGKENATDQDLLSLMKNSDPFIVEQAKEIIDDSDPEPCKLIEFGKAENDGKKMVSEAMISTMFERGCKIPRVVGVRCSRDEGDLCVKCIVNSKKLNEKTGITEIKIPSDHSVIAEIMNSKPCYLHNIILSYLGVSECKSASISVISKYDVKDVIFMNPLELTEKCTAITQQAYIVADQEFSLDGDSVTIDDYLAGNTSSYEIIGRSHSSPIDWSSILIINSIKAKEENMQTCQFTEKDFNELKIFQPNDWSHESLTEKLNHIYEDLSINVTRIFQRKDLHQAIDMAYHSVLNFWFEGKIISGLIDCLIAGDSSQGKSEAVINFIHHYGLGVRHDCGGATPAGLLGGLDQTGNKWYVKWGVIPLYDKHLVVLEEIKGAKPEVLSRLRDMRSSKIAEVAGIRVMKAPARTRLIMISNPRSDRPVSSYNYGVAVIKELMGNLEDVRRFDYAHLVSQVEIENDVINQIQQTNEMKDPYYSASLCKKGVLFAWTRRMDQIKWADESYKLCIQLSNELCNKYTESIPLCDKGSTRYKVARASNSLACRTFSVIEDRQEVVLVRPCHVYEAYNFLDRNYSSSVFGYDQFTKVEEHHSRIRDIHLIRKELKETKYSKTLIEQLLYADKFNLSDLQSWCNIDRDSAQSKLSLLNRNGAVFRDVNSQNEYVKSSDFIALLKELLLDDSFLEDNIDVDAEF